MISETRSVYQFDEISRKLSVPKSAIVTSEQRGKIGDSGKIGDFALWLTAIR